MHMKYFTPTQSTAAFVFWLMQCGFDCSPHASQMIVASKCHTVLQAKLHMIATVVCDRLLST